MAVNRFFQMPHGKTRAGMFALSFFVLLAMLLTACGGGNTAKSSTTQKPLVIAPGPIGNYTDNFSPYNPVTTSFGAQGFIYETLLYSNNVTSKISPWLASSYSLSPDAKVMTFTLHSGIKWSDGQPLTAKDVVFTFNMLKQYPAADGNGVWSHLSSVTAPNNSTIVFTLNAPYSPLLPYIGSAWIVPQHLWQNMGDPTKYANTSPVGTGPYLLKSFTPQLITLTKNSNYWQPGKPQVNEVQIPAYNANNTVELQLDRGNIDWTGLFAPNIQKTFVARNPSTNHYWFPPASVIMLYLNTSKAPFNQLAVRQAISDAIDRNQLNTVGESGYEPPASPTSLLLPNSQSYLASSYSGASFSVDTSKAAQLLQQAGFTKSNGVLKNSQGQTLSFGLNVVSGWTDWTTDCQIIANELNNLGMKVTVNALSYNAYVSALQSGSYDAAISWTTSGPTPFYLYNALLNSQYIKPLGQISSSNWERFNSPTVDSLLKQYETTSDAAVQLQAIQGIEKVMVDQLPAIPLVYGASWNENVTKNFTGFPTPGNEYASPSPYNFPDAAIVAMNLKPV